MYDRSIQKKKFTYKKLKQIINDNILNFKARWMLFVHRIQQSPESRKEEYKELIGDQLNEISMKIHQFSEKLLLVPTTEDRIALVNEVYGDYFYRFLCGSFIVRLITLPFF